MINFRYRNKTTFITADLHNEVEQEITVIEKNESKSLYEHFKKIAYFRIKLSDLAARNIASMEFFVLLVMVIALIRLSTASAVTAGDVLAMFTYVIVFVSVFDVVPILVLRVAQFRGIAGRILLK
jgi:hypothetical protein